MGDKDRKMFQDGNNIGLSGLFLRHGVHKPIETGLSDRVKVSNMLYKATIYKRISRIDVQLLGKILKWVLIGLGMSNIHLIGVTQ